MRDTRTDPCPLHQERENRSPFSPEKCSWVCHASFPDASGAQLLFPRGQGEGERSY
jgi:hypothetical protein